MNPVSVITGMAAVLDRANVDTDQIIPARFLRRPRADGYNNFLFHDLRQQGQDFPLSDRDNPPILLAGPNFGCGSSREGAVYALQAAGIACVIAPGFGDIFAGNAGKNGLLTVVLPTASCAVLREAIANGAEVTVDLPAQQVRAGNHVFGFEIDPFRKQMMLAGRDDIDATLAHAADIADFEANIPSLRPWSVPS